MPSYPEIIKPFANLYLKLSSYASLVQGEQSFKDNYLAYFKLLYASSTNSKNWGLICFTMLLPPTFCSMVIPALWRFLKLLSMRDSGYAYDILAALRAFHTQRMGFEIRFSRFLPAAAVSTLCRWASNFRVERQVLLTVEPTGFHQFWTARVVARCLWSVRHLYQLLKNIFSNRCIFGDFCRVNGLSVITARI